MNIALDAHNITFTGGIERFVAQFADVMARRGHHVVLFTYASPQDRPQFPLPPSVSIVHYDFSGDAAHIPALRRQILACKPDVFISPASYNDHLLWCAALEGTGIPWIYSEHSNPWIIEKERWNRVERHAVLCAADAVHLLLDSYRAAVPESVQERVRVIPNPLDIRIAASKAPTGTRPVLLSLGRLAKNKQNVLLLRAFAALALDFPEWRLEIWGEGNDKPVLQREIDALGIQENARLCGSTSMPQQQYAAAGIFCIPSRYEGFPLALIEAMACALPVVGFAGCSGVNELVRHGENGLLAQEMTVQSLAATLRALMENEALRRELGENARRSAESFAPAPIFDAWERLLAETAARKGATRLREYSGGAVDSPELSRHYMVLRRVLSRKNVLLQDSQWVRRIIRRHPLLKKALRPLRHLTRVVAGRLKGLRPRR